MDMVLTWLHHLYIIENFIHIYIITTLYKVGMNTKPYRGKTLQKILLPIIVFHFYPRPGSNHHIHLELSSYNIGVHRGTFLIIKESNTQIKCNNKFVIYIYHKFVIYIYIYIYISLTYRCTYRPFLSSKNQKQNFQINYNNKFGR